MRGPAAVVAAVLVALACRASAAPREVPPEQGGSIQDALDSAREGAASMRDLLPAQLVRYHFDVGSAPASPERAPSKTALRGRAGYTRAALARTAGISWEQRAVGRRRTAVYVRAIHVDYALSQRILVAQELPEGGCAFAATWQHELRHAADFTRLFTQSLPEFKASVDQAVAELRLPTEAAPAVVDEASADRLRAAASQRLVDVVEARAADLQRGFERARADADAPAVTSAVAASCPAGDWLSASAGPLEGGAQPSLLVP